MQDVISNPVSIGIVKSSQQSTITDAATGINLIHLRESVLICPHLRLKKDNLVTADEKGLTQIHADKEKRYMNNSDANKFDVS
ncbi:hypothetical protein [Microcoleus sp. AR_TQ3_B6]|uniref:hypothetical protein n=1 Tax=Microcoleus sp. AR_TQ3_B6 TaxID=3055284 RepID=UPI002FCFF28A